MPRNAQIKPAGEAVASVIGPLPANPRAAAEGESIRPFHVDVPISLR